MSGSKLQIFTYTLGIVFIILSFIEFGYGTFVLQPEIASKENKIENYDKIRDLLWDLNRMYGEFLTELLTIDYNAHFKVDYNWITEEEGDAMIIGLIPDLYKADYFFYVNFLKNYLDEDYGWLFTEQVLRLDFVADDISVVYDAFDDQYSDLVDVDEMDEWYIDTTYIDADYFLYKNTYEILRDWSSDSAAIYIWVDFDEFDDYVEDNFLHPLLEAQNSLNRLFLIGSATTIGLLLLAFLVDFGEIHVTMKKIYLIIALISVAIAVTTSLLTIIRIIMGGF